MTIKQKRSDTLEERAIKLFVECYGWIYTVGGNVLKDEFIHTDILNRWIGLTIQLEKEAKKLYNAVPCEQTKRGWKRALEMKVKFYDRRNCKPKADN